MVAEFDALVAEQTDRLLRAAYLLTGNQQDAEDLVQDTWLAVHRRWMLVRASNNRTAYVRRMITNRYLSQARRKRVVQTDLESQQHLAIPDNEFDASIANRDALVRALQRIPPRERTALILKHYLQLNTAEIGEAMNIADSSVRSAIARGAATLRNLITTSQL